MEVLSLDTSKLPNDLRAKVNAARQKLSKELAFNLALIESGMMFVIDEMEICEKFAISLEQLHDFQKSQREDIDRAKTELFISRKMIEKELRDRLRLASVGREAIMRDEPDIASKIDAALKFSERYLTMADLKAMSEILRETDSPNPNGGGGINITINSPVARAEEALARRKKEAIDVQEIKPVAPVVLQLPEAT